MKVFTVPDLRCAGCGYQLVDVRRASTRVDSTKLVKVEIILMCPDPKCPQFGQFVRLLADTFNPRPYKQL